MTIATRQPTTYHLQYLRWHTQQERRVKRLVLVRFSRLCTSLTLSLQSMPPAAILGILDMLVSEQVFAQLLRDIYTQVGVVAAKREFDRLMGQKSTNAPLLTKDRDPLLPELPQKPRQPASIVIDHYSQQWRDTMQRLAANSESASRISQVTAKTRQLVRDVLSRGAQQGWTLVKISRGIRKVLVDPVRALLIARTETTRAANAGHEAGAMSTLLKLDKRWIATADGRTRPDHAAMLGSAAIPRDALFSVGGVAMKYPGDPAGGAANICNCRCVVSYVPSRNQDN